MSRLFNWLLARQGRGKASKQGAKNCRTYAPMIRDADAIQLTCRADGCVRVHMSAVFCVRERLRHVLLSMAEQKHASAKVCVPRGCRTCARVLPDIASVCVCVLHAKSQVAW